MKDEFNLSMGKTPARSNPECWENGTHRWISISDMATYTRYTGDTSEYITDYAITDSGIKAVPKGTIIMSFKLSIGRTAITSEDIYTNEAIMAFADFDEKKFDIDFLHFLIANKNWLLGAKQAVKGQTLNKESIGNAKIIIPPIEMQEEFASIYNQADKSKFMRSKSQFIEMFGSIDNNKHRYPVCRISEVCDILNGYAFQSKKYVDTGIRVIRIANVQKGYIEDTDPQFYPSSLFDEYEKYMLFENDLLLSLTGNVGRVGLLPKEMLPAALNQRVACIRPTERINKTFLFKMMNLDSFEKDCIDNSSGSAQKNMSTEWLKRYKFILPPMYEQKKFVRISEQADKSKLICHLWKHSHCRNIYTK